MRSSAVVAVGTALSRITGFVRIAAIAYALGATDARRHLQLRERDAQHRLRAAARRRAHRDARPAVREVLRIATTTTRPARSSPSAMLALSAVTVVGVARSRRGSCDLYTLERARARTSPHQQELATDAAAPVHAADAVLRHRRARRPRCSTRSRRFVAAAFAPILNNVVVIAVFLALPRIADGSLTGAQRARRRRARPAHRARHDRGRRGDGARAAARAAARAHAHLRFLPAWRHPAVRTMLRLSRVDGRLRDREPDRAAAS